MRLLAASTLLVALALPACKSREEVLTAAEEQAKLLAEKKARMAKGVGEALKTEGAAAAEALGEGAGNVINGAGRGLEKGIDTLEIAASADLAEQKLKVERAARHRDGGKVAVKVYLVNEAPFKGTLQLVARDKDGREVGRARNGVEASEPNGQYVVFEFDALVDLSQATRYEIATIPPPAATGGQPLK